jgi:hypothetical protein
LPRNSRRQAVSNSGREKEGRQEEARNATARNAGSTRHDGQAQCSVSQPSMSIKTAVENVHQHPASGSGASESRCFVKGHDFSRAANGWE